MEHLVVCLMGEAHIDISSEITKAASSCECALLDCRLTNMGNEFIGNMLIGGTWNALAKFESQIANIEKKFNVHTLIKRTTPRKSTQEFLPYAIYVIGKDQIGLAQQTISFFTEQGIEIRELYSESYPARSTGITLFSLSFSVNIPADIHISEVREQFMVFCDRLNLDGILEAEKN